MLSWKPVLRPDTQKYLGIVEAIEDALSAGRLLPGDRLPTQRELAAQMGVTVSTVTRGIAEAMRRGLVTARTGSGTFVAAAAPAPAAPSGSVDLDLNTIPTEVARPFLEAALVRLAASGRTVEVFGYQPVAGLSRHHEAMAAWLAARGLACAPGDLALTHGTQHALAASLHALARPGDAVLCERWTYTGIRRLAAASGLRLVGMAMDAEGLLPDDLAARARASGARLLLCSAVGHNPTAATMSAMRRRAVLDVCRAEEILVVEDDIYGHLADDRLPPLAALEPDRVVHVSSLSKSLAPGIRLGVVLAPAALRARIREALLAHAWVAPGLHAELFQAMVEGGGAEGCLVAQRAEAAGRRAMLQRILGRLPGLQACGYHAWLPVPPPWRMPALLAALAAEGVRISPAAHFAVDEPGAEAPRVRIALGGVDLPQLAQGLERIMRVLRRDARQAVADTIA